MEKICILPPEAFDGTALIPHVRARYLAEEQPPLKFRTFYDDFSPEITDLIVIQAQLLKEIKAITEQAIEKHKSLFREPDMFGHPLTVGVSKHKRDIINNVMSMFFKSPEILLRVGDAFEHPEIVGIEAGSIEKETFCAGFIYGIFWYGINAQQPDQNLVCALNGWHKQLVDQAYEEAPVPQKKKSKKRGFFF